MEKDFPKFTLKPLQREILISALMKPECLLALEMGSGKTLIALCYACIKGRYEQSIKKILVVVPANLIGSRGNSITKTGWIGEWDHFFDMGFTDVLKNESQFEAFADAEKGLFITTYDSLKKKIGTETFTDEEGEVHELPIFMSSYIKDTKEFLVIADEATKIKGAVGTDTLVSKAFRQLDPEFRLLLTGTPGSNYVSDSFHLLSWLSKGDGRFPYSGKGSHVRFVKDFQEVQVFKRRVGHKEVIQVQVKPRLSNHTMFWKVIRPLMIRATKLDLNPDMVEKKFVIHEVKLGTSQAECYKSWLDTDYFARWFVRSHDKKEGGSYNDKWVKTKAKILGQLQCLRGAVNNPEALEIKGGAFGDSLYTPKFGKIIELTHKLISEGEKVVIFSEHLPLIKSIQDELQRLAIEVYLSTGEQSPSKRSTLAQQFKETETPSVFLATMSSSGYGLNLQVASKMIVAGLPWNYAHLAQATDRCYRLDSEKDVEVHLVLSGQSYDSVLWNLVKDKEQSAGLAFDGQWQEDDLHFDSEAIVRKAKEIADKGLDTIDEDEIEKQIKALVPIASNTKVEAEKPKRVESENLQPVEEKRKRIIRKPTGKTEEPPKEEILQTVAKNQESEPEQEDVSKPIVETEEPPYESYSEEEDEEEDQVDEETPPKSSNNRWKTFTAIACIAVVAIAGIITGVSANRDSNEE